MAIVELILILFLADQIDQHIQKVDELHKIEKCKIEKTEECKDVFKKQDSSNKNESK